MELAVGVFGLATLLCSLGVVIARQPLTSALWLVATMFLMAVNYLLLDAEFVATLQVLIYAGAIMVLVIFVIMLLGLDGSEKIKTPLGYGILGVVSLASLIVCSGQVLFRGFEQLGENLSWESGVTEGFGSVKAVGLTLFSRYIVGFELVGVLLLAAVIAAVLLAKEPKRALPPGRGLRAMKGR